MTQHVEIAATVPGWIKQEYGAGNLGEIPWDLIRRNIKSMMLVLAVPKAFPKVDRWDIETRLHEHREFLRVWGGAADARRGFLGIAA